ncbi:MAG: ABC transporter substrate-binding protein [Ilumatobacteraceae bacterium]
MKYGKRIALVAASASMIFAACGSDGDSSSSDTTAASDSGSAATESLLNGEIKCENQFAGKTVSVFSPVRDSDNDAPIADYVAAYQPLMDCTGLSIDWQGTDQFETEINVRLEGGNAPDVIDYPQPGLMAQHVAKGYLTPLTDEVAAHTKNDFISGWDSYSTVDGVVYGIPGRSNIKSLVWYSPKMFADGGYEIPTTLDELKALSDKIVADGGTPWCVGAESGVATGWVLTDWMEDFMLRVNGPEVYDQWVNHEIPFNDPKVAAVVEAVGEYVKNPDYLGGEDKVKAIATTKFQDGGLPILDGNCYMHRQASFYASLWPEGTVVGADGDVNIFYLPSPAGGPKYMLGAGDIYAAGSDKPETMAVLAYTGSADYQIEIVNKRQELSPNKSIDINSIEDPFTKQLSELQASADVFRFDASDLMPGAVGAGSFWTEVTNWVIGQEDTQAFVDNVEKSWPAS